MDSYFYPTRDKWFDELLKSWKASGTTYLCFPFNKYRPSTLPKDRNASFWMYLCYSGTRTEEEKLKYTVPFRVWVVEHSFREISGPSIFCPPHVLWPGDKERDPKVWFKCDSVQEIRRYDGEYLHFYDFKHTNPEKNSHLLTDAPYRR